MLQLCINLIAPYTIPFCNPIKFSKNLIQSVLVIKLALKNGYHNAIKFNMTKMTKQQVPDFLFLQLLKLHISQ